MRSPSVPPRRVPRGAAGRPIGIAIAAAASLLVGTYGYFRRALVLTDKDTIVLADFKNTTGGEVFEETLRRGMAVELEQSPFLSLVSDERIRKTLGFMGRPADARLTPEAAREICERTGKTPISTFRCSRRRRRNSENAVANVDPRVEIACHERTAEGDVVRVRLTEQGRPSGH